MNKPINIDDKADEMVRNFGAHAEKIALGAADTARKERRFGDAIAWSDVAHFISARTDPDLPTPHVSEAEKTYRAAIEEHRAAWPSWVKVHDAYRAGKIGDEEFLMARAIHDATADKVDAAEAAIPEA